MKKYLYLCICILTIAFITLPSVSFAVGQENSSGAGEATSITTVPTFEAGAINYYPPLDSLSPELTYLMSFLAMLFGVTGTIFILKAPKTEISKEWFPVVSASEPLFKP